MLCFQSLEPKQQQQKLDALTKAQKFPESKKALMWYSDVSGSDNSNELTDDMLLTPSLHKVELWRDALSETHLRRFIFPLIKMSVIRENDRPPQLACSSELPFKKISSKKRLMSKQILFLCAGG